MTNPTHTRTPPVTGDRRSRRVAALARWPVALVLVSWRYFWRTTPIHRSDVVGDRSDLPPPAPHGAGDERVQRPEDGRGTLLHRRYSVRIRGSSLGPEQLMERLAANHDRWSPEFAVFRRTRGTPGRTAVGDEFLIRMPGPWDGPVRVCAADPTSFTFVTLRGHLEAGRITFAVRSDGDRLVFSIESWARPGDRLSHLLYNHLRVAKEVQLNMWTHACIRAAALAGGRPDGGVTVRTRRFGARRG
ncbi:MULTISPECIES: DUF1990 family protein [unclassified Pseudonocardia]|uniref:DUF1990 family protein n=1 Tax=unclassified Pseudonocardia TaxID=2619320 RepID=UPI0001FFE998|nr:DUF1990 family protein [Pseudonocardia sp. Ae707_Ps1]OLM19580.1 hypothetical protein Ae707Ps1_3839c [Pseudonocardia sp. Ae707_Ps1]